jgi:hypothetical protein
VRKEKENGERQKRETGEEEVCGRVTWDLLLASCGERREGEVNALEGGPLVDEAPRDDGSCGKPK